MCSVSDRLHHLEDEARRFVRDVDGDPLVSMDHKAIVGNMALNLQQIRNQHESGCRFCDRTIS